MTVYIEYALLENFIYDGVLLQIAFWTARVKTRWYQLCLSALLGSIFAVIYPFIVLPAVLSLTLKIAVGGLLCLLPFGGLKTKKAWGRYVFTVGTFFLWTFAFGGALQIFSNGKTPSPRVVFIGFAALAVFLGLWVRKYYEKRELHAFIYPCTIDYKGKSVFVLGYYDSGNCAERNGVPICFLSPELIYEIFGEEIINGRGQVCDETEIITMSGAKNIPLYRAEISVKTPKTNWSGEVYLTPSRNMIAREYKILLNARILEG
ncbi:MAG: sigma-E processing peptidase SpoIIGA [Clostridia bacterium]|nr:sigma-E processing peptidase SpoIIGA [Clostridia bacterium]